MNGTEAMVASLKTNWHNLHHTKTMKLKLNNWALELNEGGVKYYEKATLAEQIQRCHIVFMIPPKEF